MATLEKFKCDACGKSYAWKPELAGKKVRCKCGGVVVVPKPAAPEPEHQDNSLDDLYALSGDDRPKIAEQSQGLNCPSCNTEAAPGAVICTNCGLNFQTGQRIGAAAPAARPVLAAAGAGGAAIPRTLGYSGRNVGKEKEAAADAREEMKMLIAPAIMFLLGIGTTFFYAINCMELSLGESMIYVPVTTVVNIFMITIGLFVAMKMLDFSLGAPLPALLKTGAIAMLPGAVDNIIGHYGGFAGGMAGWAVALLMYYALLMWFFDLDGMEVYIVTCIFWFVRTWLGMFVVIFLLSTVMNLGKAGSSGVASSFLGGGSSKSVDTNPSTAHGRINNRAENNLLIRDTAEEAKEWADSDAKNIFINLNREQTVKLIDDLYAAGAEDVTVSDVVPTPLGLKQGEKLVVELPDDPAKRKKIFALADPYFKGRDVAPVDNGPKQAYMILDFDGNDE